MAWRDELRTASFRGVIFYVAEGSLTAGRRLARHEYPQRDVPWLEDMGKRAREYKIDAYVIGDDYMRERDDLLNAIEAPGAGALVHPWHGSKTVTVSECSLTESTQYGGMAKFAITFVEAGERQAPDEEVDTEALLDARYDECDAAFAADFDESFSIDGLPDFAVDDALDAVNSVLEFPGMVLGELSAIRADLESRLQALLPENLLSSLEAPLRLAGGLLSLIGGALRFKDLFGFSSPLYRVGRPTPTRMAIAQNRTALSGLVLQAATARRVVDLARAMPATREDAVVARSEIVARTDAILLDPATRPGAADALVSLRTAAVAHFARIQPSLPRIVRITPQAVRPALVLAHEFYGDSWLANEKEDELLTRNRVRHPGFFPAGQMAEFVAPPG